MSNKLTFLKSIGNYKFYYLDVSEDSFIHFTYLNRANQILDSKKLLSNPPYEKSGIDGVQAISLVYGNFVQGVVGSHLEKKTKEFGEIVGIVFKTEVPPEYGVSEEVIWRTDVPLKNAKIVSYSDGKALLSRSPEKIDDQSQVIYTEKEIKKIVGKKMTSKNASRIKKYEHINFVPPKSVAEEAARGLEYRKKAGGKGGLSSSQAKAEGIGSGVQRAVNLKNRDELSPSTVKRMKAFFDRHNKNRKIEPGKKPYEDRGYVSWLLWGGDPGYTWSKKVVEQMESAEKTEKTAQRVVLAYLKTAKKTQLEMGIDVEKEHTDVYNFIKSKLEKKGEQMPISRDKFYSMIAKAHLKELKDYYTRLQKMEEGISKEAVDFSEINALIQPGRTLTNRELARAIRLAITAEHDAVHLYELVADTTTNIFVRKVLQDVANEEKVHVGEFEKLLSVIDAQDSEFVEEGKIEVEEMMVEEPEAPVLVQAPVHPALR